MQAQWWDCSIHEYHASLTEDSHSSLQLFREERWKYYLKRVCGQTFEESRSSALAIGQVLHLMLFEPDEVSSGTVILEVGPTSKAGRETIANNPTRICVTADEFDTARAMANSVLAHDEAMSLLSQRIYTERSVRWAHDGCPLKCRFDALLVDGSVADIKSSRKPRPWQFPKEIELFGYHKQAALYAEGRDAILANKAHGDVVLYDPEQPHHHYWIVPSSEPPHETYVYKADPAILEIGRQINNQTISELMDCRMFGDGNDAAWRTPGAAGISEVSLPYWEMRKWSA